MRIPAALLMCCLAGVADTPASAADSVIVRFDGAVAADERAAVLEAAGAGAVRDRVPRLHALVVDAADPRTVARRLDREANVDYAEPNALLRTRAVPDDPYFGSLYGLHNDGSTGGTADADIDALEAWKAAGLGTFPATGGVKVGVIDTGVRTTHGDLRANIDDCGDATDVALLDVGIREGTCEDETGHGTHVTGTIAASGNNGVGITGVAFDASVGICRALHGPFETGTTADVADCITWLSDRGARVISMSLGGPNSQTLEEAVRYAWRGGSGDGAVLLAAAGNSGNESTTYPAALPEVVSVAATDDQDRRAAFSAYNSDVELSAPGVGILSTWVNGRYESRSGTSMATPHAAGAAALLWRLHPNATAAEIRRRLVHAVDDLGPAGRDPWFGHGRLNLLAAVAAP